MAVQQVQAFIDSLAAEGGETGRLIASRDWTDTPLGPVEAWPLSLRTSLGLLLRTPVPMVMLWGEDGVMLYNDSYSLFAGGRHPKLLGSKVREGWQEVAEFNDNVMRVGLAGGTLSYKDQELTLYRHGLPEQVWMNLDYSPVPGDDGLPAGVLAIVVETTERMVSERQRHAAEERLRELNADLESEVAARTAERDRIWQLSPDLMCVARTDGTLLSVNPAWERLLGWSAEWLAGRNAGEIKHPDDGERTRAELVRLAEGGYRTFNFEDRYRHKDGSWRWISWVIEPEGSLIYCVGRDVTAEKATRAALEAAETARREADALYRAYFEHTPEALFVIGVTADGGFVVEEVNPAHEAGVGLKIEDIRGKRMEEILPPGLAERVTAAYRHVIACGEVYQYREIFDMPRGPEHWDTSLVPVRDADGRITRLIGSSRNVTRQVVAEEALRQAQKMEAVGQLTGGIAHDFNNLLGAVVGSLDLIRRKPTDVERVKRFAEAGLEAAGRGAKLTSQLLAFSRAQRIELKPVLVSPLVEGMQDMLTRTLGPMVRLKLKLGADAAAVMSDPTQLEMTVLNLAINARDAMPEGGDLTIATERCRIENDPELATGDYVELTVIDTGFGMPPDVVTRAFDPFFTTKGIGKGTGLGLSQVYGIARQAGGTVRIESRPGAGTIVRVMLPETEAPASAGPEIASDQAAGAPSQALILVVDDDPDMRRILVASLHALGYRVAEAGDGEAGLAALDAGRPDLLVVDFAMPGMNGVEVAKGARERHPDLPIVFASGYSDTAAIESVADGETVVIRKPFRIDELQAVIASALRGTVTG
ncbi:MAG TPA: PAS domain S-box protein [Microvirga sp.]